MWTQPRIGEDSHDRQGFVGIDISKLWLDIAFSNDAAIPSVPYRAEAIKALLAQHDPCRIAVVAFEPTGGYERSLRAALPEVLYGMLHLRPEREDGKEPRPYVDDMLTGVRTVLPCLLAGDKRVLEATPAGLTQDRLPPRAVWE